MARRRPAQPGRGAPRSRIVRTPERAGRTGGDGTARPLSSRAIEEREWRDFDAGGWPQDDRLDRERPWAENPFAQRERADAAETPPDDDSE